MTPAAIIMMIVTILLVWGGLVASVVMLQNPANSGADDELERLLLLRKGRSSDTIGR